MFKVIEIVRTPAGIDCEIEIDGDPQKLEIAIQDHGENLRAFQFSNLSTTESHALANRDEFKPFQQLLWKFVDGESVNIPTEIVASTS